MQIEAIYGANRYEVCERTRPSSRAIIIKDGKLLLVRDDVQDMYMLPGGGLEGEESLEQCCIREVLEETGYYCKVLKSTIRIDEYYLEMCFSGTYFICEITGIGEQNLTDYEAKNSLHNVWMDVDTAYEMFADYKKYADYWEKESTYLREYSALKHYFI
ncbi:MAG: NUDIX domain-containing protein [Lachnospiraceae bacterium]